MRRNRVPQYIALCAIAAVAGCATVESPPPAAPPPAAPPAEVAAPTPPPKAAPAPAPIVRGPASNAATMDAYKKQVAAHIVAKNSGSRADALPSILKSVVTLNITVDRDGRPVQVTLFRGNGHADLERAAIASVHRAGPLPAPSSALLGNAETVSFLETWLFLPDGRYQVRSVAENQRLVVPSSSVASTKKNKN